MTTALPGAGHAGGAPRATAARIADAANLSYRSSMWALVLRGLLGLATGALILARPLESVAALALVIALWAIFDGITNMARAFALRDVAQHWWVLLVAGIVGVGFGAAALYYYPTLSLAFAVAWTGWWLLLSGAMAIFLAVQEKRLDLPWGWTLFVGLVSVAAGVMALVYPAATLAALMGLIAAFALVAGALMLVGAAKLHGLKRDIRDDVR